MSDYLKEARKARRQKDFSKAGDFFYLAGDEKGAMEMYLKGGHYSLAARMLEKSGEWKEAAKYYVQAGKISDAAEIYSSRLKDYRTASAMFEKNGDVLRASEMAEKAGDIPRAAFLAEKADLLDRAAHLFVQAQKYERAADVYFRRFKQLYAEREEKGFIQSHRTRMQRVGHAAGTLYLRYKKYEKAAEAFELNENYTKAAECYSLANQWEKAAELYYRIHDYESAYQLLSRLEDRLTNKELLADICFQKHDFLQAGELYLQIDRKPRAAEAFERAEDYQRAAYYYEMLEDYPKAAELNLKQQDFKKAAQLFEKSKNFEQAAHYYEEADMVDQAIQCLIRSGGSIRAAKLLIERKNIQPAISILQQIHPEDDDYSEACILLGQLFTQMEMYSVAQQKFKEAIRDQPLSKKNIETYYGLAFAYEKAAQYSKAREIYEKIISVDLDFSDTLKRLQRIKTSNLLDGVQSAEFTPTGMKRMLASRYELMEKLGKDPFGKLYRAMDTVLARPCLIRRFPEQDKNITRNILEQTRIVSGLIHSNILTIYDSGKDEDYYFVCMEYVEGPTLRQRLSHGPIEVSEVCELVSQICLGLAFAHKRGIVHKNLCPENIYCAAGNQIKISNFGIDAKWEKGSTLISKQYSSPEQILGQKVDLRTDFYSLGIVLYEMLYGKAPFNGQDVELQHIKQAPAFPDTYPLPVPVFLLKIMQKCLHKDPKRRYADAEMILDELEVADIVAGMILNQRYEIIKEIGLGGMGHVYKARDRDLDEIVALKVLRAEISTDPVIQKRFLREIKVTRMIAHPCVVKVFDTGKYKGNRYISMEYIEGISLDDWLKKGKPDFKSMLAVIVKILQGVQAAHTQGIIHRDLKPQNVLIDKSLNPHVLDFGIARSMDNVDATSGQIMGSPKYMSPEQIQGKDLDGRSDQYATGVLMFLMFTGEEPFTGEDPRTIVLKHLSQPPPDMLKLNPDIPDWIHKIILKTLEKDRNQRYSSLKELLDDLKKGYESHKHSGE
ncbi:protein kinase [bacterium]|nr:protein kinase [bacterium]MCI0604689.1 protein kinase [bacterium]